MPLGRWFGVRIRLSWTFLGLLGLAGLAGYWQEALVLLLSLGTHELAHLMAARLLEVPIARVDLLPFGGVAVLESGGELDPHAETAVAVAGPLNSFLLLAGGVALQRVGVARPDLLQFFIETNLGLACFNLLPALPLDGGRIYRALLARRWGYRRTTRHLAQLGRVIALLMALGGVVGAWFGRIYLGVAVMAAFLYLGARRAEAEVGYAFWLGLLRKKDALRDQGALPVQRLLVRPDATLGGLSRHFWARRFHVFEVVDERFRRVGEFDERQLADALGEIGPERTVADLLRRAGRDEGSGPR